MEKGSLEFYTAQAKYLNLGLMKQQRTELNDLQNKTIFMQSLDFKL